jgi:hypothetical protein
MIPALRTLNTPDVFTPWLLQDNPYIEPIIHLNETFQKHKTLLYDLKKKKHSLPTLFDVLDE